MSLKEAMDTWKTIDQVPQRFVHQKKESQKKENVIGKITDSIYDFIWGRNDKVLVEPSINAIEIPEEYRK